MNNLPKDPVGRYLLYILTFVLFMCLSQYGLIPVVVIILLLTMAEFISKNKNNNKNKN